ncbi:efflux RND transporter periplasmic adaptor subunit [Spirosoma luteum]|uniref:efflux RND transporter periplasmic adaptor subunit n=1 Tax=Spirosoma luteum TaxID=431553 RepID=UPI000366F3A8|nr:efflux RND transporter periplasmic adaptor subunit [Spirosoma luteum]
MTRIINLFFGLLLTLAACTGGSDSGKTDDSTAVASRAAEEHQHPAGTQYTCPMHPQVVRDAPGSCPICNMDLVPINKTGASNTSLVLSESQMQLANVSVQPVSQKNISNVTVLNARLAADQEQTEVISSRVAGRIERLFVKETGQAVRKGQVLYEIYSEPLLIDQQEYLIAVAQEQAFPVENRYVQFRKAAEQKLRLYGMTPDQITQLARTKTVQPRIPFVAPSGGTVTEIAASEGQYVTEGALLYRLVNLGQLWVEAELYPGEAGFVKVGDRVPVEVTGSENGQNLTARVVFINPEYREGSQVLTMRAVLPNPGGRLQPGQQARVIIRHEGGSAARASQKVPSLTLPTQAVVRAGEGSVVFVQTATNTFQPRRVQTGTETDERVAITSGLTGDEAVVMSGAYLLYSEMILKKGVNPFTKQADTEGVKTTPTIESNPVPVVPTAEPIAKKSAASTGTNTTPDGFKKQLTGVYDASLPLTEAFISTDVKQAKTAAVRVEKALSGVDMTLLSGKSHNDWMNQLNAMNTALKTIRSSDAIETQRLAYGRFGDALYTSLKAFGINNKPVYRQFCPMAQSGKGAYWLSDKKPIRNPYFGEQMLTCGETKEVLQ